ncbi:superoxide dismutase [Terricaulis silvestris]|uniref:Superoxide dismutase n=1 Tax=Terricaulis silvestris TaxID=2686094 RepID=A0A6I6MJ52_9CAUL|nr:superoxide dismutase [Terricaulis silvestris]QGZ93861.1 Superoxide dismutase [Fe] [Terricaulis silvestris]
MFKLPPLPFAADALEPAMSRDTLNTHHGKHHAAYIKKMNAALEGRGDAPDTLEDVVRLAVREKNAKLFNNAAQAWNHAFFWASLTPQTQSGPQGELLAAIEKIFTSVDKFREEAKIKGENHFASGWLWLVADATGAVQLQDLHDAQTPIVDPKVTPLLVCDLWEHAYYLDYKNERGKFLDAFLSKLANWHFAEAQYDAARNGGVNAWRFPS